MIDLDELLYGNPPWDNVVEFWRIRSFHEESYLVMAVKKHLRTPEQQLALAEVDVSIEDMVNGRVTGEHRALVNRIFCEWNTKLGFSAFGF